ncbi:glycogen debranching protein GlgX [Rhodococcus sp. 14-2470-1a]|uniref:glycogen debranching protein GlgX n=1 Tax=Rhodococcus sp. 14-2470-1a TaxID=2023150 RepID=UPI000B9AC6C0|nr:glycogen debranching protein GlgX [Rhodococcus sp. 14-2470-1a]OZF43046.1 glycogen debranching enzyme GlgX [Rhodococcus sp. 14-2470-1a]
MSPFIDHTDDRPASRAESSPPGSPFPLGATASASGTQFAVHSPEADGVEVCLVDPDGSERRVELREKTFGIRHGFVPGVTPGTRYGFRAHGPWDPAGGRRFNGRKILLDPAGRQIAGQLGDAHALLPYDDEPFGQPSTVDSLGHMPLSVVTDPAVLREVVRPSVPWDRTVLYELHVGAYTARHPDVPAQHRGTYLGLTAPAVLRHLTTLGVTTVELLPVQAMSTEPDVRARGMRNHWGYSTGAFFAPDPRFASEPGAEVTEFKTMVDVLHSAGIEVVLDVVYNHTCESSVSGPSISWRGLDAPGYYLLDGRGYDVDITGCGNTLDSASPAVVRMVCDSLRYWTEVMGVDGFRFDLASTLGRPGGWRFDSRAPLLTAITTDPVLSRVKLIAEPWDATGAGYQVGGFGPMWSEWNDRYRDTIRRFWAEQIGVRELASRLAGSEDIYGGGSRKPWASINFVTAHDGFTARDLVSYSRKHNEANGEENRDGTDNNISVDHGVEGPTDDPAVTGARARHVRALLATLALSTGTPMLLAGDELGHTQFGNNNAYCIAEDAPAEDAWAIDWSNVDSDLVAFVSRVLRIRRSAPSLRQQEFFFGRDTPSGRPDLVWFDGHGSELTTEQWNDDSVRTIQAWVDGGDVRSYEPDGVRVDDDSSLLIVHSGGPTEISLACPSWAARRFAPVFDSAEPRGIPTDAASVEAGSAISLTGPGVLVFRSDGR